MKSNETINFKSLNAIIKIEHSVFINQKGKPATNRQQHGTCERERGKMGRFYNNFKALKACQRRTQQTNRLLGKHQCFCVEKIVQNLFPICFYIFIIIYCCSSSSPIQELNNNNNNCKIKTGNLIAKFNAVEKIMIHFFIHFLLLSIYSLFLSLSLFFICFSKIYSVGKF